MRNTLLLATGLAFGAAADAQNPALPPNAPTDKPVVMKEEQLSAFEWAIQPFIEKARATYPAARKRFLAGLPQGETFFVATRLHDPAGSFEQVFIAVQKIDAGVVSGRIWSDVQVVKDFKHGDMYEFPESEVLDWLISKPDGSEEGNYVGKFLDAYQPK